MSKEDIKVKGNGENTDLERVKSRAQINGEQKALWFGWIISCVSGQNRGDKVEA